MSVLRGLALELCHGAILCHYVSEDFIGQLNKKETIFIQGEMLRPLPRFPVAVLLVADLGNSNLFCQVIAIQLISGAFIPLLVPASTLPLLRW